MLFDFTNTKNKRVLFVILLVLFYVSFSFANEKPAKNRLFVRAYRFVSETSSPNNNWQLFVSLNKAVMFKTLKTFLTLQQNETQVQIKILPANKNEKDTTVNSSFIITPAAVIAGSISNTVIIKAGLFDETSNYILRKDWKLQFNSFDSFTLTEIIPSKTKNSVVLVFNDWINKQDVRDNINFHPYLPINWYRCYVKSGNKLHITANFNRGTKYLITFGQNFKSRTGKKYFISKNKFTMSDFEESVRFDKKGGIIERDSRQLLNVRTMNISEILYQSIHIPPLLSPIASDLFRIPISNKKKHKKNDNQALSLKQAKQLLLTTYRKWLPKVLDKPEFKPFLDEIYSERELFFQKNEKNKWNVVSLPTTFRKSKNRGAVELIQLQDNRSKATTPFQLFRITDFGITVKQSNESLLVWLTSLRTGAPVNNVALAAMTANMHFVFIGKTNKDGFLIINKNSPFEAVSLNEAAQKTLEDGKLHPEEITCIIASSETDASYLEIKHQAFLTINGIKHIRTANATKKLVKGYLFTERGIYRPAAKVYYKAVLRDQQKGNGIVPENKKYILKVLDAKNREYLQKDLTMTEYGTVYGDFKLKSYDPLGTYTMKLFSSNIKNKENSIIARRSFEVQEFRAPRHYAEIQFKRLSRISTEYINLQKKEELLQFTLSGKYYAGGPIKHGKVRWRTYFSSTNYHLPGYSDYHFGYPASFSNSMLENGEATLDEKGIAKITIPLTQSVITGMYGVKVAASVIDFDGRSASKSSIFQTTPQYYVGLKKHSSEIRPGINQKLSIIVVNNKGKKIRSGNILVEFFQKGWSYLRKRNDYGNIYWSSQQVWRKTFSKTIPIKKRLANLEFDFAFSGNYLIKATYQKDDEKYISGTIYEVYGDNEYDEKPTASAYDTIAITTDKSIYEIGDKLKISIQSRHPLHSTLLTIEREGILTTKLINPNQTISLPITKEMLPNVYLSVIGTTPRGNFPIYKDQYDISAPSFAFASKKIEIHTKIKHLSLIINNDKPFKKALPASQIEFSLETKDEHGLPTQSEIAVGVVDERVLALTAFKTPTLQHLLRFIYPLEVFTYESRLDLLRQTPFNMLVNEPLTGGGGSFGPAAAVTTQLRKNFNPVAYFNPSVITDDKGRATVNFTVPDTMTKYRVYAVACDKGARFAAKQSSLTVVKDFYIEPGLPRFFRKGDKFTASVSVLNKTNQKGNVNIKIETNPSLSFTPITPSNSIAAFDSLTIPLAGKAIDTGDTTVLITGIFDRKSDSIQLKLPIETPYLLGTNYLFGDLNGNMTIHYDFPDYAKKIHWKNLSKSEAQFMLTLSTSPFLNLERGLKYLLQYPYGCIEQTSSVTMPLAALRNLIKKKLIQSITLEQTDKYLKDGIARICSMQTPSGGFSYWPGERFPDKFGTLYAVNALFICEKSGIQIPEARLIRALQYLKIQISSKTIQSSNYLFKSWAAYLLAQKNMLEQNDFENLRYKVDFMSREASLFLILAAQHTNYINKTELRNLARETIEHKKEKNNWQYFNAIYRKNALALIVEHELLNDKILAATEVQRLLKQINPYGYWSSTSDTGWILLALGSYFKDTIINRNGCNLSVSLQGEQPQKSHLPPTKSLKISFPVAEFYQNPNIAISTTPPSFLLYQLEATYPNLENNVKKFGDGFSISKEIKNTNKSNIIKVGDIVKITIFIHTPDNYSYAAIVDPLPAGFVAINSALKTEENTIDKNSNEGDWWNYWNSDGYYSFYPNHFEIHDDKVLIFKNFIWKGDFKYSYFARAVCEGTFILPPSQIQLMYYPEIAAQTQTKTVTIAKGI